MFNLGIKAVTCVGNLPYYGRVWLVDIKFWKSFVVIEDDVYNLNHILPVITERYIQTLITQ